MEVPAPQAGVVKELKVKLGDRVSEGSPIIVLESREPPLHSTESPSPRCAVDSTRRRRRQLDSARSSAPPARRSRQLRRRNRRRIAVTDVGSGAEHPREAARESVGAEVRPRARRRSELGQGQRTQRPNLPGRRAERSSRTPLRIRRRRREDRHPSICSRGPRSISRSSAQSRRRPLSRIRSLSKANLARNWVMIPHVTQFDEADVTELEEFRKEVNEAQANGEAEGDDARLRAQSAGPGADRISRVQRVARRRRI